MKEEELPLKIEKSDFKEPEKTLKTFEEKLRFAKNERRSARYDQVQS